ncbi:MAG: response regulator [Acidobacteria bacterium]|nr:response regulator [Acidobacteriota bacterium]
MGIKILLADDSVTAQNMGKKILSEAGHDVVTVSNGAAAAKKIAELKPEVVLLDVFMPGYSGLELCEKLRNASETAKIPVLLTVGKLEPYSPAEGARVKADGVIIKPFEAGDLTAAVERLAQKLKAAQTQTRQTKISAKSASEFKDESYLAWKQDAPIVQEEESAPAKKTDGKPYEETVRLDASQIAAMLKVAEKNEKPGLADSQSEEFSVSAPVHGTEDLSVTPALGTRPEASPNAGLPVFEEELGTARSGGEVPSYMSQYLSSEPAAAAESFPLSSPVSSEAEAPATPAFEIPASSPAFVDDNAATMVLSKESLLQQFGGTTAEPPTASAEGLELTAVPPVGEVALGKESGFEPTLQSGDAPTMILPDPALVTDPHHSTMDFVTQFGGGEPGLADQLLQSMNSGSEEKAVDDFEARLNAAMSAFGESPAEPPAPSIEPAPMGQIVEFPASGTRSDATDEENQFHPSAIAAKQDQSFGMPERAVTGSMETEFEALPSTSDSKSWNEGEKAPHTTHVLAEVHAAEAEPTPVSLESAAAEQQEQSEEVNAVSSTFIAPAEFATELPQLDVAVPETDEAVIQQMREAFSDLPVDHSHVAEHSEAEHPPMAMAAAAAVGPVAVPTTMHQEAELEIARALSAAVGAESSSANQTESSPAQNEGDANKLAAAVEDVMKRELPTLIWKIMAELDLRKRS